jgi:hypothetical protein
VGLDAWILVLDTKGINVWCAAGKRTFGTKELVNRIKATRLEEIISHRRIIVPQLGAVGISAHEVKKLTESVNTGKFIAGSIVKTTPGFNFSPEITRVIRGFNVVYGPVKAKHIKEFIRNKYIATKEMRRVTFTLPERAILIPVDFIYGIPRLLIAFALFFILSGINRDGISFQLMAESGPGAILYIFMAYFAGIVITPLALPYIPGRSFAFKGFISGIVIFLLLMIFRNPAMNYCELISWFLIITAISSFIAMNFTGSSTYTSLSGVKKEMKIAVPLQVTFTVIGLILFLISKFL